MAKTKAGAMAYVMSEIFVLELSEKITENQNSNEVVVIVIETAPTIWTEGGAFWEVANPQVSNKSAVNEARKAVERAKENQRIY